MRKFVLAIILFLFVFSAAKAQYINRDKYTLWQGRMGIGVNIASPYSSIIPSNVHLMLGDSGTTKAFLPPRITHTSDISIPIKGMFVFCYDSAAPLYYDGSAWVKFGSGGGTYTASNGITLSGSDFKLGGYLNGNTIIKGNNLKTFGFDSLWSYSASAIQGSVLNTLKVGYVYNSFLEAVDLTSPNRRSRINIQVDGASLLSYNSSNVNTSSISVSYTDSAARIYSRSGKIILSELTNSPGTKSLRYNPSTGLVSYGDTAAGGSYADSLRRSGLTVQMRKGGVWTNQFDLPDSTKLLVGTTIDTTSLSNRINEKADTSDLLQIDTTGVQDGDVVTWDAAGEKVVFVEPTGGGSTDSTWHISFKTGVTTYAPAVGDSLFKHTYLAEKVMDVYRNGIRQVYDDSVGYQYIVADTTIQFFPVLDTNERIDIVLRDSTRQRWLALEAPASSGSTTIAYVNSADGGNNGGSGTSRTWSHTVSSGSDRYLLVGVVGDVSSGADDVSTVTYNGVSMTLIAKQLQGASSGNRWQYVYGLANPDAGAHNVVVTFSSSHWILGGSIEYTGVQGVDTYTSSTAYTNSKTTSITTGVDNCWTVLYSNADSDTQTAGSGSTLRRQSGDLFWSWFDSGAAITPAGAYSMNTTRLYGSGFTHIIISLKPY